MLKTFFALLLSLTLPACVKVPVPPPVPAVQEQRVLPPFNGVMAKGIININLVMDKGPAKVILTGDPRDVMAVVTVVRNGSLVLERSNTAPQYGPVLAEVHLANINAFSFRGVGEVQGNNLNTSLMDLRLANEGRTTLGGKIGLRSLTISGPGFLQLSGVSSPNLRVKVRGNPRIQLAGMANISMLDVDSGYISLYWVKSPCIVVRARGKSTILLAGIADKLDVELHGDACFRGRYLRVRNAFVKTFDHSNAEISAFQKQHSLASGQSDIHFYEIPSMRTDFMAFNGAVLDMRDWNNPFLEEYTRYNK